MTRVLIASDDERAARRIQKALSRGGMDSPSGHLVSLEDAAGRAGRLAIDLMVIVLPSEPERGLEVLREAGQSIRGRAYVLVLGPATDPKLILRTLHSGADEYLDMESLESELAAAMVRFKTRQVAKAAGSESPEPGRVISVLGPSGGSGASTLAANLSAILAQRVGQCGLIDLRLAVGDLASMLDLKPTRTMADLCDHLARVDTSMFSQFFTKHACGVHLLAAPVAYTDIGKVTTKEVRRTLAMARGMFPYVVADLDNGFSSEQVEALWHSDVILVVLRLDYISVRNARRVMDNLKATGISLDRVELVANRCRQPKQLPVRQAEEALGKRIRHRIPDDPGRVNRAINKGTLVVLKRPFATISKRIKDLATDVNGYCPVL